MSNGWDQSAEAWIADMGESGDFSREFVLDPVMLKLIGTGHHQTGLDVGCGEGRFCRLMNARGIKTTGVDPTEKLLNQAIARDSEGCYVLARAEELPFADDSFDLVVSYLTLIDIDDHERAVAEMARVLKPQGTLLIANLTSFSTASAEGWVREENGDLRFSIDHYLKTRAEWVSWRGIRIKNWHRPLSEYLRVMLSQQLTLRQFLEPAPCGGDPETAERFMRVPYFYVMEWQKA